MSAMHDPYLPLQFRRAVRLKLLSPAEAWELAARYLDAELRQAESVWIPRRLIEASDKMDLLEAETPKLAQ